MSKMFFSKLIGNNKRKMDKTLDVRKNVRYNVKDLCNFPSL